MESLVLRLFDIKAIKFGEFHLKSGIISPIYLDMREIIGYPKLMNEISEKMYEIMTKGVNQICGVPYTALPIASCISVNHEIPMVIKRKETKDYGTKKLIEGVFDKGMTCTIIEDVITTGSSVIETVGALQSVGLAVTEAIVLIDRCQGGRENLINSGINVKSVLTIRDVLSKLLLHKKITTSQYELCNEFIETNQTVVLKPRKEVVELGWKERANKCTNKIGKKLFTIINEKQTNLCVAADVRTMAELLSLAKKIAPFICILKIHADIVQDFDLTLMKELKKISIEEQFLIMEDRKFADIGNTVKLQFINSHFDYISWCDLITVHGLPGDGIFDGIKDAIKDKDTDIGCLIVAEMSSAGALTNAVYKESCAEMALRNNDIVVGFISQSLVKEGMAGAAFIHCTPGIKLEKGTDHLGQNYRSVSDLRKAGFVDIFIVGRGVIAAEQPDLEAKLYRKMTFDQ